MPRILLSGAGLSTVAALVLGFGLGFATTTEAKVSILTGLVAGLIGLTVTAVFALEERLREIDAARIGALPLQRLLAIPEAEDAIVELVDTAAKTKADHGRFMQDLAHETLEEARSRVCRISDGTVQCEAVDELRLVSRALEYTERSVRAVAARGLEWWTNPEADVYWQAYGRAAKRLDISRIFVLQPDETDDMTEVLLRHHNFGMRTFVVHADQVPQPRIRALVVFDDNLLHRHAPRTEAELGYRIEFTDRGDEIIGAQETFHVLLDLATAWTPGLDLALTTAPRHSRGAETSA